MKTGTMGEFVLGGFTTDNQLSTASPFESYPIPLAAYVRDGGPYLWRKYYDTGHDSISAIKFNPDGSRIIAGFSVFGLTSKTNA